MEIKMNTKLLIPAVGLIVCLGASANADLYEMVFSGELDSVTDTRTTENDPFAGTAWAVESYSAQIGDIWEYRVTYDTDTVPGDLSDEFAIYGLSFETSASLNGNVLELTPNTQLYFIGNEVEIFGENENIDDQYSFVHTRFTRADGLDDLINGGELFTDASIFKELNWTGFLVGGNDDLFDLDASPASGYTVIINQIPTPSTLLILGGAGLIVGRRRR